MKRIFLFLTLTIYAVLAAAQESTQAPFDVAQVFEWWDDGIITPEEADEIFSRLEEENYDEACLLAEVYAQEPCATTKKSTAKPTHLTDTAPPTKFAPSLIPHGHFSWKGQYDSDGHLKKHRTELLVQFYYFKLRLGSQELLTYRRDGFEAHFGQVSTLEFRSHLPLDTLWGTALLYPLGKFRLGTFLDSNRTFRAHIDFKPNRHHELSASFWRFPDANAITLQAHSTLGQISAWYQIGQDLPLVKIQLQSEQNQLSWKTTAYLHGDSIPQGLNLSKGIVENWLWASQTVNVKWPEALNTILSFKARILSPTASDSVSARFKSALTTGPERIRSSLSITCVEASDNCNTTEWKGIVESAWEQFTFNASARLRHNKRTKPPKIELNASYHASLAHAKLTLAFPETSPTKTISVQNEVKLDNEWLSCNLVFALKKTKTKPFKPNHAHLQVTLKF